MRVLVGKGNIPMMSRQSSSDCSFYYLRYRRPSCCFKDQQGAMAGTERRRDHASTRWERDHPDQQGDVTVTEERTRDHASTRWEREHPDDEQAE
mmetsp:Transcript_37124/g.60575  ORF Transcript_37124/g.60575 Transcript_37124/m.60575 type:complete len:94 (+) Transcript_37124:54-335(+)